MKKKQLLTVLIFASAGAIFQTAIAGDAEIKAENNQRGASIDLQGNINESAGAELKAKGDKACLHKASDLIGASVRNQQDEKIGVIKDVMVDFQSGQAPFAVLSSGGFFGVGDRLLAIPTTTFEESRGEKEFVLSMDRQRLESAPSFDKNSWPNMGEQAWSSEVYSYYDAEPATETSFSSSSTTRTEISEPSGADSADFHSGYYSDSAAYNAFGETETGLSRDRTPRQGLGAEDLTQNEQKIYNPGGYAESHAFIQESSGADNTHRTSQTTTTRERKSYDPAPSSSGRQAHSGKVKRASELIGMEVKNARDERIGEIKDVVIDIHSGRVAYTVLDAGGLLSSSDKLYAVPPAVFTRSSDERWLVFNTDKEQLMTAPSFEKNSWPQTDNQAFTTEVYRFYHQQPYWQSSGTIREPAGSELKSDDQQFNDKLDQDSSRELNDQSRNDEDQIQEPSGAAAPSASVEAELNAAPDSAAEAQAEPERDAGPVGSPRGLEQQEEKSSAAKETAEAQSAQSGTEINEAAGATTDKGATSVDTATAQDQSGSAADRDLSKKLRAALETDTVLSTTAQNVKVSTANGKVTLTGTVESEQQKQSIGAKAQQIAGGADKIDNQLRVSGLPENESNTPSEEKSDNP